MMGRRKSLQEAEAGKQSGNAHFKAKKWNDAIDDFSAAIDLCEKCLQRGGDRPIGWIDTEGVTESLGSVAGTLSVSEDEFKEHLDLLAKCYLNRAMTSQRLAMSGSLGSNTDRQLDWLLKGVRDCNGAIGLKADYKKAILKKADIYRDLLDLEIADVRSLITSREDMYLDVISTLDKCIQVDVDFDSSKARKVEGMNTINEMKAAAIRLIDCLPGREERKREVEVLGGEGPPPSRKTIKVSFSPSSSSPLLSPASLSSPPSSTASMLQKQINQMNLDGLDLPAPPTPSSSPSSASASGAAAEVAAVGKGAGVGTGASPLSLSTSVDKRRADILKLIRQDKFEEENITVDDCGSCRFLVHLKWWSELMSLLIQPPDAGGGAKEETIGEVNNWRLLHSAVKLKKVSKSSAVLPPPSDSGASDNSRLVHAQLDGFRLKEDRKEGKHYKSVTRDTWDAIQGLYGGGPALPRFVREKPEAPGSFFLDVRPDLPFSEKELSLVASYLQKRNDMAIMRGELTRATYPPNDCGATVMQAASTMKVNIEKDSEESEEIGVTYVNSCFVCGKCAGHHCAKCSAVHYCSRECQAAHWKFHKSWCKQAADSRDLRRVDFCKVVNVGRRGHVGIQNLGNSCYLNSILQCLSHLKPLTSFFLSNAYESQLNMDAVFGTKGMMVSEYVSLLQALWFGDKKVISPKPFKSFLGRMNEAWAGSSQQDSEEVLNFILDKLHEDLNRVKKKPYVERDDGDGTNCVEVAAKEWKKGFLREDSIVKDTIGGLYRSRIRCPECGKESVSFDYFSMVTLELKTPSTNSGSTTPVAFKVLYFPNKDRSFPTALMVHMRRSQTVQELENEVRNLVHSVNRDIKIDEAVHCYRMSENERTIKSVLSGENPDVTRLIKKNFPETHTIAAYPCTKEVRSAFSQSTSSKFVTGALIHRRITVSNSTTRAEAPSIKAELVGLPWLTTFQTSQTCLKLRTVFWRQIVKFLAQDSPVLITLKRLKEAGDVMAEVAFHKKMASLIPLRFTTSNGIGKVRSAGKTKEMVKLTSLCSDHESLRDVDKAYIDGNVTELGAALPCDEVTTVADFFGGADQVQGYPFFAMDWVQGGYFESLLEEENLEKVNEHASMKLHHQTAGAVKARGATGRRTAAGAFDLTIEQCFDEYTKDEINRELTWTCSGCKKDQIPQKKMSFLAGYLPDVLIVSLKRFAHRNLEIYSGGRTFGHQQKIDMYVDFPLEGLNLAPYCTIDSLAASGASEEDCLYDLFAVCNHYGRMGFGHYTAFAREWLPDGDLDDKWLSYDDDSVMSVSTAEEVKSNAAYVLFYKRRKRR